MMQAGRSGRMALLVAAALGAALHTGQEVLAQGIGSAFTYQGYLTDGGAAANGTFDFELALFPTASGGTPVGSTTTINDLTIANGTFTVTVNPGAGVIAGSPRWIEIRVRPGAGGSYTTLSPRQPLLPAPTALFAATTPWSGVTGVPAGLGDGDDNTTYTAGTGLGLSGGAFSITAPYRLPQGCGNGQIAAYATATTTWVCIDPPSGSGNYLHSDQDDTATGRITFAGSPSGVGTLDASLVVNPPAPASGTTLLSVAAGSSRRFTLWEDRRAALPASLLICPADEDALPNPNVPLVVYNSASTDGSHVAVLATTVGTSATGDVVGLHGEAKPASPASGQQATGLFGSVSGFASDSTGAKAGVSATVSGLSNGPHYGVYGLAEGSTVANWGLFTPHDAYVGGKLDLGPGSDDDLTASDVSMLAGGGNADTLHTHDQLGGLNVTSFVRTDADSAISEHLAIGTSSPGDSRLRVYAQGTELQAINAAHTPQTDVPAAIGLRSLACVMPVAGNSTNAWGVLAQAFGESSSTGEKIGVKANAEYQSNGHHFGVTGEASGSTVDNTGVSGSATGASPVNYGVYGKASGATTNWGLYTPDNLGFGDSTTDHHVFWGTLVTGSASDDHVIVPHTGNWGKLGLPGHYWYRMYARTYYGIDTAIAAFTPTLTGEGVLDAIERLGTISATDPKIGAARTVLDPTSLPAGVADGGFVDLAALGGLSLEAAKELRREGKALDQRLTQRITAIETRLDAAGPTHAEAPARDVASPGTTGVRICPAASSERFRLSVPVAAGDVVAIDRTRPGALQPARLAADTAVVGVVATAAGGDAEVVVSGTVACRADASYGAIAVGDLLVASPTPGHAMRAANPALGTVVAKALEPLAGGTGAIQVLVMLR